MATVEGVKRGGIGGEQGSSGAGRRTLGSPDSGGGKGTSPKALAMDRSITVAMGMKPRSPSLQTIPLACLPRGGIYVQTKIGPIQV